jgi:hypothetical protein
MKFAFATLLLSLSLFAFASTSPMSESLSANDALFNALLGTDQKVVGVSARSLVASVQKLKAPELAQAQKALESISEKNTKEANLNSYSTFMEAYLPYAKKKGLDSDHQVFYCPMVKKYWFQNQKMHSGIKNVFAQEMLECGEKA